MIDSGDFDFSFSGLKTSVLYYLRDNFNARRFDLPNIEINSRGGRTSRKLKMSDIQNIAASFQKAAIDVLVSKTLRAARKFEAKSVMLSGGVAANAALRRELKAKSRKLKVNFFVAPQKFNTDNATMIAVAAYIQFLKGKNRPLKANANLNL